MTTQCNCPQCSPHLYKWVNNVPYQKRNYGPIVSVAGIIIIAMFLIWAVNTGYFDSLIGFVKNVSLPALTVDNTPVISTEEPRSANPTTDTEYTFGETVILNEENAVPDTQSSVPVVPTPEPVTANEALGNPAPILEERGETLSAVQPLQPENRRQAVYFFTDQNGDNYYQANEAIYTNAPVLLNGEFRLQIGHDGGLWVFSTNDSVYIEHLSQTISLAQYPVYDNIIMVNIK